MPGIPSYMGSQDIIIQYIPACAAPRIYPHYIRSSQTVDLARFSDLNFEYKQVSIRYEKFIIHIQITYTSGKGHSFLCTQVPPTSKDIFRMVSAGDQA